MEVLYKLFLKISQHSRENTSLFFDKNVGLQAWTETLTQVFFDNTTKFLRAAILKNICERLLLRVFPFMLVWTFSYMNKCYSKLYRK